MSPFESTKKLFRWKSETSILFMIIVILYIVYLQGTFRFNYMTINLSVQWIQTGVCSKWLYPNQNPVTCIIFFSINILHIDCYCVKGLWCCFPIELFFYIYYYIDAVLICKYAPFWQEVSVKSVIVMWPLRPVGLLFFFQSTLW